MELQAVARRRDVRLTLAMQSQLSIVAPTSFAKRRLRFSQAKACSTTQRRGNRTKPRYTGLPRSLPRAAIALLNAQGSRNRLSKRSAGIVQADVTVGPGNSLLAAKNMSYNLH